MGGLNGYKLSKYGLYIPDSNGIDTSDATATASDILKDKTAYANGSKITGVYRPCDDFLVMNLDGIDNTGSGHNTSATTWQDLKRSGVSASKGAGTTTWGDKYLQFDGSTNWSIPAPNGSKGTLETVVSIDTSFTPVNNTAWYNCSCIVGTELNGTQRDLGILVNASNKFAVGYDNSTIWSSSITANDGAVHTLSYSYDKGPCIFAIDGTVLNTWDYVVSGSQISTLGIGWNYNGTGTRIKGKIYSVKWYSRVLTAAEILADHSLNVNRFAA